MLMEMVVRTIVMIVVETTMTTVVKDQIRWIRRSIVAIRTLLFIRQTMMDGNGDDFVAFNRYISKSNAKN